MASSKFTSQGLHLLNKKSPFLFLLFLLVLLCFRTCSYLYVNCYQVTVCLNGHPHSNKSSINGLTVYLYDPQPLDVLMLQAFAWSDTKSWWLQIKAPPSICASCMLLEAGGDVVAQFVTDVRGRDKWLPFCAHKVHTSWKKKAPSSFFFLILLFGSNTAVCPSGKNKHASTHTRLGNKWTRTSASKSICSIECEEEVDLQGKLLLWLHLLAVSKFRGWRLKEQKKYRLSKLQKPHCDTNREFINRASVGLIWLHHN